MDYSYPTEISQASLSYGNDSTLFRLCGLFSLLINTFFFPDCIVCFIIRKTQKSTKKKNIPSAHLKSSMCECVFCEYVCMYICLYIYLESYCRCFFAQLLFLTLCMVTIFPCQ